MTDNERFQRTISFLSETHFRLGVDLALKAKELEASEVYSEENRSQSQRYAIGAVVSAANSMEASINQFFNFEVSDSIDSKKFSLSEEEKENIKSWWNPSDIKPILVKYQKALELGGKTQFIESSNPYEDAVLLNSLRNKLVHYKPKWTEVGNIEQIEQIYGGKFTENQLYKTFPTYFPARCLGFGCAKWALETTYNLVTDFYERMGKPNHFSEFVKQGKALL